MRERVGGLWRNADFVRLWAAQTISVFGTQVTLLALPLTAALALGASPAQMGVLTALEFAPFPLFGLFVGVWVDRRRRRPILVAADVGRGVVLLAVPIAALLGVLRIELLFVVAPLVGTLTVCFDVAYRSYLPALVARDDLVEGNSKLEVSSSTALIAGPGLAGLLVQLLSAPVAILVDALSFIVSALFLGRIRRSEPPAAPRVAGANVWAEIGAGLRIVIGNPLLRAIAGCTATLNLFGSVRDAVFILYLTRELGLGAGLLGAILAVANAGPLTGAVLARRLALRFGLGPPIIGAAAGSALAGLLIPLAAGPWTTVVPLPVFAGFGMGLGGVVYNVNQVSLRQVITPDHLLGRMNATVRVLIWGTIPLGALLGGVLGERIGLRPTLAVGSVCALGAILWPLLSPVRTLREPPPVATMTTGDVGGEGERVGELGGSIGDAASASPGDQDAGLPR